MKLFDEELPLKDLAASMLIAVIGFAITGFALGAFFGAIILAVRMVGGV